MNNFKKWNDAFNSQKLYLFNKDKNALLWLKIRAICRSKQLSKFVETNDITLTSKTISDKNKELFSLMEKRENATQIIDKFLKNLNNELYRSKIANENDENLLKKDLYKIHYYIWGGDQSNSLDKYYVNHYVKDISNYETLQSKKREIAEKAWNYIQNSWYNNWTSFLIESIFKKNPRVISAVGEIKSVDFFIEDYPIDLKVTFFPNQFMEEKLQSILGKKTLPWLKLKSKEYGITYDKKASDSQQLYEIKEKLMELDHKDIIQNLNDMRREIIDEAKQNPIEIMTWLYEHQGERRFGAENRIYLILYDTEEFENSWKLKRAYNLIKPIVTDYLNSFSSTQLKQIDFQFKDKKYKTLADTIFIIK